MSYINNTIETTTTSPSNSILLNKPQEPTRPYSAKEVEYLREKLYSSLNLNRENIQRSCGHIYKAKRNYVGTSCSVCYKLRITPRELLNEAHNLLDYFTDVVVRSPSSDSYYHFQIERMFYIWLYRERFANPIPPPRNNNSSNSRRY